MQALEKLDEIIVFRHYETAIDANLAKTKLDANDIPCFLTEENFSTLYIGQSFQLFGVRLHLFRKDSEQASEILGDQTSPDYVCPKCDSHKVEMERSQKIIPLLRTIFIFTLTVGVFPIKKVHRCQHCGFEF